MRVRQIRSVFGNRERWLRVGRRGFFFRRTFCADSRREPLTLSRIPVQYPFVFGTAFAGLKNGLADVIVQTQIEGKSTDQVDIRRTALFSAVGPCCCCSSSCCRNASASSRSVRFRRRTHVSALARVRSSERSFAACGRYDSSHFTFKRVVIVRTTSVTDPSSRRS